MSIELITNIIVGVASLAGFLYGAYHILIRKKPLYLKMAVMALACMLISCVYTIAQHLVKGYVPGGFHVGMLGLTGCFLFLFSANYGMIDGLADDGSAEFLKYRIISWIAPIVLVFGFFPVYLFGDYSFKRVIYLIIVLLIAFAAKYHFKHLIFPDVDYGVVRAIRGYNAIALILCIATNVFLMSDIIGLEYLYLATGIVMAVCCIAIIPVLKKEATKWTTI